MTTVLPLKQSSSRPSMIVLLIVFIKQQPPPPNGQKWSQYCDRSFKSPSNLQTSFILKKPQPKTGVSSNSHSHDLTYVLWIPAGFQHMKGNVCDTAVNYKQGVSEVLPKMGKLLSWMLLDFIWNSGWCKYQTREELMSMMLDWWN